MPVWTILKLIRENPDVYAEILKKRYEDPNIAYKVHELDKEYRKLLREVELKRHELNKTTEEIESEKDLDKKKELIEKAKNIKNELNELEKKFEEIKKEYNEILYKLPNILDDDVPLGEDDTYNKPIKFYGKPKVYTEDVEKFLEQTEKWGFKVDYEEISWKPKGHAELLEEILKLGDCYQASQVATSRFWYEFNDIVWLDFALALYALDFLRKKGYKLVIPPYMLRRDVLFGALDFSTFEDMIYKIEGEDLYLIGTAEHSLLALYYKRVIEEDALPIKLAGWSPCFRKEAGAHGKDTKGIFRVHQFHKVEQFIFCKPEDSKKLHEELRENIEQLWEGLGIPFRTVVLCTGDLSAMSIKTYDLEAWFPAQAKYREEGSCSNCWDWQAFRANLVYAKKHTGEREYVHTLNSTAIAIQRAICAILENNQDENGVIEIPKVLRKYLEPFESAPKEYIEPKNK